MIITGFTYGEHNGSRDVYFTIKLKEYKKIKISTYTPKKNKTDNESRIDEKNSNNKKNKQKTHTVKSGETIWDIAKKEYGKGSDYTKIILKNKKKYPSLAKSKIVKKGWVLNI